MKIKKTRKKFCEGRYSLDAYNIGEEKDSFLNSPSPQFRVGNRKEVESLYASDIRKFHRQVGAEYINLPYTFFHTDSKGGVFGDFSNGRSGCRFDDIRLCLTSAPFHPSSELHDLWRLSSLLQPDIRFTALERNTFVRGLRIVNGHLELTIGAGLYPEAAYGVNSSGLILGYSENRRRILEQNLDEEKFKELQKLLKHFNKSYGKLVTICQVVHKMFGRVPTLGEAYSYIMGGAALVRTNDGKLILTRRSPGTTSVNHGINMPTSGGANFDEEGLLNWGLPIYLRTEMLREAREELGIRGDSCELQPLGLVRELTRGCTPDALHMIFYRGTAEEIVSVIAQNPHPSRREIDRMVFALDIKDARRLVRDPRAEEVLHHKALVALVLADRAGYLS